MSHQQEWYFWQLLRAELHAKSSWECCQDDVSKAESLADRLCHCNHNCQQFLSHLRSQRASSFALFGTASLVRVPLSFSVFTQHILSFVHNVLQLLNKHFFFQKQNEIILHLRDVMEEKVTLKVLAHQVTLKMKLCQVQQMCQEVSGWQFQIK